jgi:hypothetical protein
MNGRVALRALVLTAAIMLPTVFVTRASATPTVTSYRFPLPPIASAGSIGPGQSVSFTVTAISGTTPDPGGVMDVFYAHTRKGDSTTVPAAQCGGVTQVSLNQSSPTLCAGDSKGKLVITYTTSPQLQAQGGVRFVVENQPSHPTVMGNTHYAYSTEYRFSSSPIATSGSLGSGATVPVLLTAKSGLDAPIPNGTAYLSFIPATGGGSASVGSTQLTSTPKLFTADSTGTFQLTYTAPSTPPTSGVDSIVAQDITGSPTEVNSDMYAFAAGTPVVSVSDVTVTEGDQFPGIPADFTLTVSPVQSTAVTVQYTTLCGVGDQGCEILIPDDFNPVLTPVTVTIPANTSSTTIDVEQFSYTGGHKGESYNEGWFVKLSSPNGAVLGRSVGEGLLLPDVESTPTVLPYLYTGSAAMVPTTNLGGGEPMYFSVTLGQVQNTVATFDFATADGTAFAGVDYTGVSGTATIPSGSTSAVIVVSILPNSPPITNKTFTLTITNASPGLTISRPTGTGTILVS